MSSKKEEEIVESLESRVAGFLEAVLEETENSEEDIGLILDALAVGFSRLADRKGIPAVALWLGLPEDPADEIDCSLTGSAVAWNPEHLGTISRAIKDVKFQDAE